MALFSKLVPPLAASYAVQAVVGAICIPLQEDRFYDLSGSLGFIATTFVSLFYPTLKASWDSGTLLSLPGLETFAPRQLLLSGGLAFWTTRLGIFLVRRALRHNGDSRFASIKTKPLRFSISWTIQALWTFLVGLPVYLPNVLVPSPSQPQLGLRDYVGLGIFAGGLVLESVADWQKNKWRAGQDGKKHVEKFIKRGVWGFSRHPNYLGEIGIWTGLFLLSTRALGTSESPKAAIALSSLSPLFTYFILTRLSGIPLIEKANEKKFGRDPEWIKYRSTVPPLWPWTWRY